MVNNGSASNKCDSPYGRLGLIHETTLYTYTIEPLKTNRGWDERNQLPVDFNGLNRGNVIVGIAVGRIHF